MKFNYGEISTERVLLFGQAILTTVITKLG